MWENERKKTIIRNILIFLVLILAAGGLMTAMRNAKRQIDAEDRQLSEANRNQRQELNEARQENLEAIQQAYEVDMKTVEQYLPGIICWGDSLTAGSSGNVSYPYTLQKYLNAHICNVYDFRSSVEHAEDYARLKWDDYKVSIPVINMGAGQEDSATILGRSGVVPYVVKDKFTIPAEAESVKITLTSARKTAVTPLTAGGAGINPVTIAGVEGTLHMVTSNKGWLQYNYEFTRQEPGEAVEVSAGTEIVTAVTDQYKDYIHIVWMGTYDTYRNPNTIVEDVQKLLSRQEVNKDRYLVLGPCTVNGTWSMNSTFTLDTIDSTMLQAFGNHYVNVRKYLIEDGLRDAGITPSKQDTLYLGKGFVPDSFRSNAAGADLNGVAYKLIGKLVYERMERLGYFDEVCQELNINKTVQEILKKDPNYFEKILKLD